MKVDIYSDIVCPWCYIGKRRFARALEMLPDSKVEIVFRPYQLDPSAPPTSVPLAERLARRFGGAMEGMLERVTDEARKEGIAIAWEKALTGNTRNAHRLMELARRADSPTVQWALAEQLFDLYFSRGGDLTNVDQLADAASVVGMDRERVWAYLGSSEGLADLEAEFEHARRLGVQAVPTFVIDGRYAVQGAQPVTTFLNVLQQAAPRTSSGS